MTVAEATQQLLDAGTDDEKITLATVEVAIASYPETLQNQLREAVFAAAIPHWFDGPILSGLLEVSSDEGERLLTELRRFSFVERHQPRKAWNIHERSRDHLLAFLFRERRENYAELSVRAAKLFSEGAEQHVRIEWIYHSLIGNPEPTSNVLAGQCDEWRSQGRIERLQAFAAMLEEHLAANRLEDRALATALDVAATIEWNYRPLAETEARLKQALEIYRKLQNVHSEAVVLDEIGDVLHAQRKLDDSLKSYQAALAIAEKLAKEHPNAISVQRNGSIAHQKVGDMLREKENFDEAMRSYEAAQAIAERLAAAEPENVKLQRDLSVVYNNIGLIQRKQKNLDQALHSYEIAKGISEKLVALDQDNTNLQRDLVISYVRIGEVQNDQQRFDDALLSYEVALGIAKKLVATASQNTQWLRDLSLIHDNIGDAKRAGGHLDDALRSYQESLTIAQDLAASDPGNAQWQHDLAVSQKYVSDVTDAINAKRASKP